MTQFTFFQVIERSTQGLREVVCVHREGTLMLKVQISPYKITRAENKFHTPIESSDSCGTDKRFQSVRRQCWIAVNGCQFAGKRPCRLAAAGLLCTSMNILTGCATSAELEALRTEVAKAYAVAARAEAGVSQAQCQQDALQDASESTSSLSDLQTTPTITSAHPSGYKWREIVAR